MHLFDAWPEHKCRISAAKRLALFLDFDGTLAPFRRRPEKASLARSTRRALENLARHPRVQIWIISGRRRADIQRRVGVREIRYLGLHGAEDGVHTVKPGSEGKHLRAARRRIAREIQDLRGIWVENKRSSFTVHYRGASTAAVRQAEVMLTRILDEFLPHLRRLTGNCAWELLPRNQCDKGVAVKRELRRMGFSPLVIYVGDDGTDELAFAALPQALTICVAPRHITRAKFALSSITEVRIFLGILLKELKA
jgi:trehalose-phosphatase